jgi:hypothetical protein
MLRPQGDHDHHYAATHRKQRVPRKGQIINVRDVDGRLVIAVIESVRREGRSGLKLRVFTIYADEIET